MESLDQDMPWKAGDRVHILAGPFIDFHGKLAVIDTDHRRVTVIVDLWGNPTPVALAFDEIEKE